VGSHNGKKLKRRDWDTCTSITVIVIKAWPLCDWSIPAVTACTVQHIFGTFSVRGLGRPPPSPPHTGPALYRNQRFLNGWVSATTRDRFLEAGQKIATSTNCIQKFTNRKNLTWRKAHQPNPRCHASQVTSHASRIAIPMGVLKTTSINRCISALFCVPKNKF